MAEKFFQLSTTEYVTCSRCCAHCAVLLSGYNGGCRLSLVDRTPDSSSGIASDDPACSPTSPSNASRRGGDVTTMTSSPSSPGDVMAARTTPPPPAGAGLWCYRYRHSDMTRRHVTSPAPPRTPASSDVTPGTIHSSPR